MRYFLLRGRLSLVPQVLKEFYNLRRQQGLLVVLKTPNGKAGALVKESHLRSGQSPVVIYPLGQLKSFCTSTIIQFDEGPDLRCGVIRGTFDVVSSEVAFRG